MADTRSFEDRQRDLTGVESASRLVGVDQIERWQRNELKLYAAEARVQQLEDALRAVKKFASDPFASEAVALRACLLEANEALGIPGPEPSPLRDLAKEIIDAALETQ